MQALVQVVQVVTAWCSSNSKNNQQTGIKMRVHEHEVLAMTETQFRLFMHAQSQHTNAIMEQVLVKLDENTKLTRVSQESSETIYSILKFSEVSAKRTVKFARFLSAVCKVLLPIVAFYGAIAAIKAGHFPSLKDLL